MLITTILIAILCVIGGVFLERYRWVRAAENDKVIAVDGNLYTVTNTGSNAG